MEHFDVIVVGAGPAGGSAAYELARGGAKVALLERHPLPRHKTCGGGMPLTVSDLLEFAEYRDLAPEAFVESTTRYFRHTFNFEQAHVAPMDPEWDARQKATLDKNQDGTMQGGEIRSESAETDGSTQSEASRFALWMVQRSVFDNALAQAAASRGAHLYDACHVRAIEATGGNPSERKLKVVGETANGRASFEATADIVIGADGANGVVARNFGLRKSRTIAIAIEAEVPHRWGEGHPDLRPEVCHLEFGCVRNGYAWVFPKADHLNVGAGVFRARRESGRGDASVRPELHKSILDYLAMLGVPKREEELTFYGHPLPIWNGMDTLQTPDNRVLLAGDAAGLINPIFGDGIFHALKSGKIAGQCVLAGKQAEYTQAIAQEFKANFDSALVLAKIFYQFPGLVYRHGVTRPNASRQAVRLLSGELRFDDIRGRVLDVLKKAMFSDRNAKQTDLDTFASTAGEMEV